RSSYILSDSAARVLVTTQNTNFPGGDVVNLEELIKPGHEALPTPGNGGLNRGKADNPAYIIYTSGTTGRPKGVLIEHRNVVRLFFNNRFQFDFNRGDVWTMFHAYNFDFSVWEMYGALLYGGHLVIVSRAVGKDAAAFLELLKRHAVTVLNQTPPAFYSLAEAELYLTDRCLKLKYVIFGGDVLAPAKLKDWLKKYPETQLVNMFGITETTVHVTYKTIGENEIAGGGSNIGSPIPTLSTYVMDRFLKLLPIGVPGECCIGGEGVARGYLNRQALTEEKFVDNPYKPGERLYRSGDLVRLTAAGEMEYMGRIDRQVKLRGFRIELGEIENKLSGHPAVASVVVMARGEHNGDTFLCAYIVEKQKGFRQNDAALTKELSAYLAQSLPSYMIPSYFSGLEQIPLTANNKVAWKKLPHPARGASGEEYLAPVNRIEEKLADIWSAVLGMEKQKISTNADFFRLGGHSLKATVLTLKIHKKLNVKIPLAEVFKNPTISGMAAYIKKRDEETFVSIQSTEKKSFYPLSSAQKRLYFLQQMDPVSTVYNLPEIIPMVGEPDLEKLENTIVKLIQRHESFRTSFHIIDEEPVQVIHDSVTFNLDYLEPDAELNKSRNLRTENVEAGGAIQNLFSRSFDLSQAPLLRVALIKHGETGDNGSRNLLLVDMHHIISDGISHDILQKDFTALYMGEELPPLRIQYKDYSEWQHSETEKRNLKQQETYWLKKYEGELPVLNIPTDYSAPLSRSFEGSRFSFDLDADVAAAVRQLVLEENSTTFIVLLAVFNLFISKLSGQDDIIIGTPLAGRMHADLEPVIGMFVNTLPLRSHPRGCLSFAEFLAAVKANTLEDFENQDYQFEDLVEKVVSGRDTGRNPIFNVLFTLDEQVLRRDGTVDNSPFVTGEEGAIDPGLEVALPNTADTAKFELSLMVNAGKKLALTFEYSTMLFKKRTIQKFADGFKDVLLSVLENKNIKLEDIDLSDGFDAEGSALLLEREYWAHKLSNAPVKSRFLPDRRRIENQRKIETVDFCFSSLLCSHIMRVSNGANPRVFIILTAGLTALIHKYTANDDIFIGAPLYGQESDTDRNDNVVVLKNSLKRKMTFKELLPAMKDTIVEAIKYGNYPVDLLARQLVRPFAADEDFPLFDISIMLDTIHEAGALQAIAHNMAFSFSRAGETLKGSIGYNGSAYNKTTVLRIARHFESLLLESLLNPGTAISDIDILSAEEKDVLLSGFNDTAAGFSGDKSLPQMFEQQAALVPGNIAVTGPATGDGTVEYTYGQLNEKANRLARCLREKNVTADTIVAIMVELSVEMVVGLWAILKAGGAYMPVDPAYPAERIDYLLADSGCEILLTHNQLGNDIHSFKGDIIDLNDPRHYSGSGENPEPVNGPEHLAYIIYTSGSTGKPKGVLVEHRNLSAYIDAFFNEFKITEKDTALQVVSFTFDAFVEEFFPVLSRGGKIAIPVREEVLDMDLLSNFILRNNVTITSCSPLLLNELNKYDSKAIRSIRIFISGGDVLKEEHIDKLKETGMVYNTYGPTETTVCVTYYHCLNTPHPGPGIPIGKPVSNYTAYILDESSRLQPVGVPGELCVGGAGVTRGYLNNPQQTAEKFETNTIGSWWEPGTMNAPKSALYHTGDLCRWLADGNIEFLGRIDQQV
ncbi:MAG: amino acid adenylation domain-containing protein, partial [bacterium]|nr:amino acid adenylation domain-containing protein [bacterium]